MCQQHSESVESTRQASEQPLISNERDTPSEPFPWDIGVFDAHCHPTDTMTSIASISDMKARALTVMSTRTQDQELVSNVAVERGVKDVGTLFSQAAPSQERIIPSFGWHPWFSYQLYDDTDPNPTYNGTKSGKIAHYDTILAPPPSSKDVSFSEGLPDPKPLSEFLKETKARLEKHPLALVGEIGLDKAFRLPQSWTSAHEAERDEELTPGGREGRLLSPHRVQMTHQATVLKAQLKLAGEMGRPVSVHGVQAHGILYDTIAECWKGHEREVLSRREKRQIAEGAEEFSSDSEDDDIKVQSQIRSKLKKISLQSNASGPKPYPPRICIHSFSGHVGVLKQYTQPAVPAKIFFSFSVAINWGAVGGDKKTEEAILAAPDDRILVESDLHTAGEQMDRNLEEVCRRICQIKGWDLREGVERLAQNWRKFMFG
ncbi:TatD family [Camillea tinctor]|nr:TatD family [Camillea tinctor]